MEEETSEVKKLSTDFANLLNLGSVSFIKRNENLDESIESVLMRLDELYGMLDMIRSDSSTLMDQNFPSVRVKMDQLRVIFRQIDDLEKFVNVVKSDCNGLETQIKSAESEFSTLNQLKNSLPVPKFFSGFRKKRTSSSSSTGSNTHFEKENNYTPVTVFKTENYFPKTENPDKEG